MKNGFQFVKWLAGLSLCLVLGLPGFAEQRPRANWQANRPPKAQAEKQQRQQARQQQRQEKQAQREAQQNANRPPKTTADSHADNPPRTPSSEARPNNPNRPPNAGQGQRSETPNPNRPPNRTVTPEERRKNAERFNQLSPQRQQEIRESAQNWNKLTPEQRNHIKNDIAPKWQQLPQDRQRAIRSRLNVLKNMPESARNQHLNDPNFTRGMNEDDKAMLRDLSHMHVGGALEAPPNE